MTDLACRDERELQVDLAADRLAAMVLSFGILAIVAWHAFVDGRASWDLLGLVVLGGAVGAGYRLKERVVTRSWLLYVALSAAIAAVVAIALGFVLDLPRA